MATLQQAGLNKLLSVLKKKKKGGLSVPSQILTLLSDHLLLTTCYLKSS